MSFSVHQPSLSLHFGHLLQVHDQWPWLLWLLQRSSWASAHTCPDKVYCKYLQFKIFSPQFEIQQLCKWEVFLKSFVPKPALPWTHYAIKPHLQWLETICSFCLNSIGYAFSFSCRNMRVMVFGVPSQTPTRLLHNIWHMHCTVFQKVPIKKPLKSWIRDYESGASKNPHYIE